MIIASDIPAPDADVAIETTETSGAHHRATLVYETWRRNDDQRTVLIRCYDANNSSVNIILSQSLVEEMMFGEILNVGTPR